MKFRFVPTMAALVVFLILTAFYYEDHAQDDGYTLIGFPFYFYRQTEGKLFDQSIRAQLGFNSKYLIIDIAILLVAIILFNLIYTFIRSYKLKGGK